MPTTAMRSGVIEKAQRLARLLRQLLRDQRMGAREITLELLLRQAVERVDPHPLRAGEIRRRDDAALFGQELERKPVGLERQALRAARLRPYRGEHLAADLEDVVVAPLDRERGAWQRQQMLGDRVIRHGAKLAEIAGRRIVRPPAR